jgi:hypothetical protein
MKRNLFIFICFFIFTVVVFSEKNNFDVSTILVIIEENENGKIIIDETPIADGIFDALWENDQVVFFDMKIVSPFKFNEKDLDVKPFLNEAKAAKADSILLIKVDYTSEEMNKDVIMINLKEYYYHFYSIKQLNSLSVGKREINYNEKMEVKKKFSLLKQIGVRILNEIYN